jgi:hypothetical protein
MRVDSVMAAVIAAAIRVASVSVGPANGSAGMAAVGGVGEIVIRRL